MIVFKYLFSPFKFPKLKFYLGKIAVGTPYFLPRRWINNPNKEGYKKAVPIKWLGIQLVGLGYKTKWSNTDYRFEWNPILSVVFCKLQFCITISPSYKNHYWESWLYYQHNTDKNMVKEDRIKDCIKEFSQVWTSYKDGEVCPINYYKKILKKKYLHLTK